MFDGLCDTVNDSVGECLGWKIDWPKDINTSGKWQDSMPVRTGNRAGFTAAASSSLPLRGLAGMFAEDSGFGESPYFSEDVREDL